MRHEGDIGAPLQMPATRRTGHLLRSEGHPVIPAGYAYYARSTGHFAGQSESRLDGVRSRRAHELHAVIKGPRLEDDTLERQHKLALRRGSHVKAIEDTIIAEVSDNCFNEQWRVVAII